MNLMIGLLSLIATSGDAKPGPIKDTLLPLNVLIGDWKATGYPEGTREERAKGFWNESINCVWQFKGGEASMSLTFAKGKFLQSGTLRYDAEKGEFVFQAKLADNNAATFRGKLTTGAQKEPILTLDRTEKGEDQRFIWTLLHHNRVLYSYHTKPTEAKSYTKKYQVGLTKEGEAFAEVPKGPECIVSGGRGTMTVIHNGKTYYVCCSGCRDAFKEDPDKYIAEYEKKNKK